MKKVKPCCSRQMPRRVKAPNNFRHQISGNAHIRPRLLKTKKHRDNGKMRCRKAASVVICVSSNSKSWVKTVIQRHWYVSLAATLAKSFKAKNFRLSFNVSNIKAKLIGYVFFSTNLPQ